MANEKKRKESNSAWQTESLRLTAFLAPGLITNDAAWWEKLTGRAPETSIRRPLYQDEGEFEEGRLTLSMQSLRVDWTYAVDLRKFGTELPTLGVFPETSSKFKNLISRWFEICPSITRLAFGAVLLQPVSSRIEGYNRITGYLPSVKLDGEGSSDFAYQINRPRPSKSMQALQINRLSKWSVMNLHYIQLAVDAGQPGLTQATIPNEGHNACRLELDINTSASFSGQLPKEKLSVIFDELIAVGKEIAERGDIS